MPHMQNHIDMVKIEAVLSLLELVKQPEVENFAVLLEKLVVIFNI